MNIHDKLAEIQAQLHAPKDKQNTFGKYAYRNAESIIAAFKALNSNASLTMSETLTEVAGHIFVTSTATLTFNGESVSCTGNAMHPIEKKGMDASQITGAATSYARKYALGGLFAIDDSSDDPDSKDNSNESSSRDDTGPSASDAIRVINNAKTMQALGAFWTNLAKNSPKVASTGEVIAAKDAKKAALSSGGDLNGDQIPY